MILCSLLSASTICAKEIEYYNFLENIDDLTFQIESPQIQELIDQKIPRENSQKLKVEFFWYKGAQDIQISGVDGINFDVQIAIKNMFNAKVALILSEKFDDWSRPLVKQEDEGLFTKYLDESGLSDLSELLVRQDGDQLQIIEKKPIGTTKTNYTHEIFEWSKSLSVINKVDKSVYEGAHFIKTESVIKYAKFKESWLPAELSINSEQGGAILNYGDVKRKITEQYFFKNYQINKGKAQKYFALSN